MDFLSGSLLESPFDCIVIDLDDTLYSSKIGLGDGLKKNIEGFLLEKCGFSESDSRRLRVELFKTYGSTLAGLRVLGYDVDADDYHSYVHGRLPYDLIKPDLQLRNLLCSIKQRKIIFTNSDRVHAVKCLERLGIQDCFEQMICFETLNPNLPNATRPDEFPVVLKPSMEAFKIAIDAAQINPTRTLFLDDNVKNVTTGRALGLRTVLVGKSGKSKEADYTVEYIHNLNHVVPEIWVNGSDGADQRITSSMGDLESILSATPTPVGA